MNEVDILVYQPLIGLAKLTRLIEPSTVSDINVETERDFDTQINRLILTFNADLIPRPIYNDEGDWDNED